MVIIANPLKALYSVALPYSTKGRTVFGGAPCTELCEYRYKQLLIRPAHEIIMRLRPPSLAIFCVLFAGVGIDGQALKEVAVKFGRVHVG
jgi:hypothetical protein